MGLFRNTEQKAFWLFYERKYAEALPLFEKTVAASSAPGLAHLCYGACAAHVTGDASELHKQCNLAAGHVDHDVLLRIKGSVLFDMGRTDEGLPLMRQAAKLNPSIKNMLVLASRLDKIGCNEEALSLYEQVLSKCPHHVPALIGSACVQVELGNTEQAKQRLAKALRLDPRCSEAHRLLKLIAPSSPQACVVGTGETAMAQEVGV